MQALSFLIIKVCCRQAIILMNCKTVYIFNPEHDLCLANGDIHFVPPESALAFGRDCASITRFMHGLCTVDDSDFRQIVPWGWDFVLKNRLLKEGVDAGLLPTDKQIQQITILSHRRVALQALEYLNNSNINDITSHNYRIEAVEVKDVESFLECNKEVVLKAPLSGSGKGIRFVSKRLSYSDAGWCRNLIAKHGYVVVEQRVRPVLEFAMLFRSSKAERNSAYEGVDCIEFLGYSLFYARNGAYRGNVLASNEFIEKKILDYIPADLLLKSRNAIVEFLKKRVSGSYEGFIGVDQFVYEYGGTDDGPKYRFNPVVEINLRMTMGLVARNIYDRFSAEFHLVDGKSCFEICMNKNNGKIKYSYKIV